MCGSMADIQSPTADIRQGKKKKKIEITGQQRHNCENEAKLQTKQQLEVLLQLIQFYYAYTTVHNNQQYLNNVHCKNQSATKNGILHQLARQTGQKQPRTCIVPVSVLQTVHTSSQNEMRSHYGPDFTGKCAVISVINTFTSTEKGFMTTITIVLCANDFLKYVQIITANFAPPG